MSNWYNDKDDEGPPEDKNKQNLQKRIEDFDHLERQKEAQHSQEQRHNEFSHELEHRHDEDRVQGQRHQAQPGPHHRGPVDQVEF